MPHRLLLRLLDEEDNAAYGAAASTSGIKSFEDELLELSAFLSSDSKPYLSGGAGAPYGANLAGPQDSVNRQPSFDRAGPSSEPAVIAERPVALGMYRGPLRCLETFHPEGCKK